MRGVDCVCATEPPWSSDNSVSPALLSTINSFVQRNRQVRQQPLQALTAAARANAEANAAAEAMFAAEAAAALAARAAVAAKAAAEHMEQELAFCKSDSQLGGGVQVIVDRMARNEPTMTEASLSGECAAADGAAAVALLQMQDGACAWC